MQNNGKMATSMTPAQMGRFAASHAKNIGITQEEIAQAINVNQSQVSRIFRGQVHRHTDTLGKICKYALLKSVKVTPDDVRNSDTLINALSDVWDGTDQDAQALAGVIRSLQTLRSPSTK
ncbi:MAG: helix-turn-helix transcriptional regulator [Burkholderiales bacterium]|nr:helix-turn-helix transcriptional regulator [Burkholderiales bacterium]